jgi:phage terminase large subunit-like protein
MGKRYEVKSITFDKWNAIQLANELMAAGMTVFTLSQHHSYLNDPTKQLERLVLDGKIVHDGNSLLRWQVGHAFLDVDGKGLRKPATNSEHEKKDNLIALVMALSQAVQHGTSAFSGPSVYETRGILTV